VTTYGQRREDVISWPEDTEARAALEEYLDSMPDPDDQRAVWPSLSGELLNFAGADLSGLDLGGAYLFNTVLTGVRMVNCYLRKATLNGADLRDADLTGADLFKAEADECLAQRAVFRTANLFAVDFGRADLSNCDLRDTVMNSSNFYASDLRGADLRGTSLRFCGFGTEAAPTLLDGARMFGCALDEASGVVSGAVDVGESGPNLIQGADLIEWLRQHGASDVRGLAGESPA
jgi:Pentapeptide repeats (8 copies)